MEEYSAFDQYNHYPSEQPPQEASPPRRARYGRRSSVTQYNIASYQPQHQQTFEAEPIVPLQRVAQECSVTGYNLYTTPLAGEEVTAPHAPVVVSPEPPQRQRYRRRSSVTQYNLEGYQQQQQTYQPQAPARELEESQPEVPRQRYRRRSSVTQYNLESYAQQQQQQQGTYHPQPHSQDISPPVEAEQPRQRYRRRSSVTQYNLESYQQQQLQQQQDQIMLRAQEVVVQPPVTRYPRRSSVTQYNLGGGVVSTPPFEVSYTVEDKTEEEQQEPPESLSASVYPEDNDDLDEDTASYHSAGAFSLESSAHITRTLMKEPSLRDVLATQGRRCSVNSFVSSGEDFLTCCSGISTSGAVSLSAFELNNKSFPSRRSSLQFSCGSTSRRGSMTSAPPATGEYRRTASFRISKPERRLSLQPSDVVNSFMNSGEIVTDFNKLDDGGPEPTATITYSKSSMSCTGQLSFDCSFSSLAGGGSGIGSVVGVQ